MESVQWGDCPVETDEHFIGRDNNKRGRENLELAEEGRTCKRRKTRANPELPEELIETIFIRSGFPGVLMARTMSRSWRDKFRSVANLKGKSKKEAAMVFQNEFSKFSLTWKISSPIIFCEESSTTVYSDPLKTIMIPLVSLLPKTMQRRWSPVLLDLSETRWSPVFLDLDSSLLLMCRRSMDAFYMVNILTRSFKVLPPCPKRGRRISFYCSKLVTLSDSYKVVIFSRERPDARYRLPRPPAHFAQIYDSKAQKWAHHKLNPRESFHTMSQPVLSGGVLYMVVDEDPTRMGALDLKSFQYVELRLRGTRGFNLQWFHLLITAVDLTLHNDKIVMLVTIQFVNLCVLEVDLTTHTLNVQAMIEDQPNTLDQCTPAGRPIRVEPVLHAARKFFGFSSSFPSGNGLKFYGDVYLRPFRPGSNPFLDV